MLGGGAVAGVFGSLLGLGGGVLLVPLLTLGFGLPLREAVGVSLISVIVTSSAAAGVYLERHVANLRLGMSLELFTAFGALIGGSIAFLLDERILSLLFSGLLLYVAFTMARGRRTAPEPEPPVEDLETRRAAAASVGLPGAAPVGVPATASVGVPRAARAGVPAPATLGGTATAAGARDHAPAGDASPSIVDDLSG